MIKAYLILIAITLCVANIMGKEEGFASAVDKNWDIEVEDISDDQNLQEDELQDFLSKMSDTYHNSELTFLADQSSPLDYLTKAMNKVNDAWDSITSVYKTARSTEIKQRLDREGFTKFDQSAQIQVIQGLRPEGMGTFINLISKRLNVPENRVADVKMVLEESQWAETNVWSAFDTIFSINSGGQVKFASIFSSRAENGKYFFVVAEIQALMELAPEVLVMTKKLSVLGGIWSQSQDKISYVPKSLTTEDMKIVFSFFNIVVMKSVGAQFGVDLPLPK